MLGYTIPKIKIRHVCCLSGITRHPYIFLFHVLYNKMTEEVVMAEEAVVEEAAVEEEAVAEEAVVEEAEAAEEAAE